MRKLESADISGISFSLARSEDSKHIERLYRQLVSGCNVSVDGGAIAHLPENTYLVVARSNEVVVATALLNICADVMYRDQPFALVENVVVDVDLRGKGVGKALMEHLKEICKERRCTKIMLMSTSSRTFAHAFFEKCGYQSDVKKAFVNYINREARKISATI